MTTKNVVITGGTDGIGKQVALRLAQQGCSLTLVGRSPQKAQQAIAEIQHSVPDAKIDFWQADLSLMRDTLQITQRICAEVQPLDTLIHCAGVMLPKRTLTDEGLETVFAVQYLARWLLIREVLPNVQSAPRPCVISVSAGGAFPLRLDWHNLMGEKFYHGALALIHESIANDMLMLEYQHRYPDIQFYCYGPFWVPGTQLMSAMPAWFRGVGDVAGKYIGYTPQAASEDIINIIRTHPANVLIGRKLKPAKPTRWKSNSENIAQLWQVSETLVSQALAAQS